MHIGRGIGNICNALLQLQHMHNISGFSEPYKNKGYHAKAWFPLNSTKTKGPHADAYSTIIMILHSSEVLPFVAQAQ